MNLKWPIIPLFLALFALLTPVSAGEIALDASFGSISPRQGFPDPHFDMTVHGWYKFDQMVFLGLGGGLQGSKEGNLFPLLVSGWIRLPFGGQLLPVATGDVGYTLGADKQFLWRAGGGFDLKNGDRTSLLFLGGYQSIRKAQAQFYLRAGILLEF